MCVVCRGAQLARAFAEGVQVVWATKWRAQPTAFGGVRMAQKYAYVQALTGAFFLCWLLIHSCLEFVALKFDGLTHAASQWLNP